MRLTLRIQPYLILSLIFTGVTVTEYQRFDGFYNNIANPQWGSAGDKILYSVESAYADLTFKASGPSRPNPRVISNALLRGPSGLPSYINRTAIFSYFGQLIAYDMIQASGSGCPVELMKVKVPDGDPDFKPNTLSLFSEATDGSKSRVTVRSDVDEEFFPFIRSGYDKSTGHSPNRPRQPVNKVSAWIDGSFIYGIDEVWAQSIRSFTRGQLRSLNGSGDVPDINPLRLPLDQYPSSTDDMMRDVETMWVTGDHNTHQNPGLLSLHVVWFRYHNHVASQFSKLYSDWSDDQIYHMTRRYVISVLQNIVVNEWLPVFINQTLPPYSDVLFESVALRVGHSMISPGFYIRYEETSDGSAVRLCNSYWNSQPILERYGVEGVVLGMTSQIGEREDNIVIDDLRGKLFGPLYYTRQDLELLSVMRGRDHGLPDYNTVRQALNLPLVTDWNNINPWLTNNNKQLLDAARDVYNGSLDELDAYIGGMLETSPEGVGTLFSTVIRDQFMRLRDADRWWFENRENKVLSDEQIEEIKKTKLSDVIITSLNLDPSEIQENVFIFKHGDPCPQRRQLTDYDLRPCSPHKGYDYFTGSEAAYTTAIVCFLLLPFVCIGVGLCLVRVKSWRVRKALARHNVSNKQNKQTNQPISAHLHKYKVMEFGGCKAESLSPVEICLHSDKCQLIVTSSRDEYGGTGLTRDINLLDLGPKVTVWLSSDGKKNCLLIPSRADYDLIVKFSSYEERSELVERLSDSLKSHDLVVVTHDLERKQLLNKAVTKQRRQRLLADFFKSVLAEAKNSSSILNPDDIELHEDRDVRDCQLSRAEFAEALGMRADSLFVSRMFSINDLDGNGLISFRELLYMVVLMSRGSPVAKLRLLFRILDKDSKGCLSRDDVIDMLKSLQETANGSSDINDITVIVDDLFKSLTSIYGQDQGQFIKFNDFCLLLSNHIDLFSDSKLDWKGVNALTPKNKKIKLGSLSKSRTEHTLHGRSGSVPAVQPLNASHLIPNNNKPSADHSRKTSSPEFIFSGVSHKQKPDHTTQKPTTEDPSHLWTKENDSLVRESGGCWGCGRGVWGCGKGVWGCGRGVWGWLDSAQRYVDNYRQHIIYLFLFFSSCGIVFSERFYRYAYEKEDAGYRSLTGYGLSLTRGAAAVMSFTFSLILLTMCRNMITLLRETFLNRFIPFDSHVSFHKIVAYTALIFSVMHVLGYCFNFYHIATQPTEFLCVFNEFYFRSDFLPKIPYWVFQTIPGFTGVLIVIVLCVIYIFASPYFRERIFNSFWMTHKLFYLFYLLVLLHGTVRVVQDPFFPYFFIGPAVLFTLDKLISLSRKCRVLEVIRIEPLPSGVTLLVLHRPDSFVYKSGQWVRLAIPCISGSEYHPFTITSAPHERSITLHVRAAGPWTRAVRGLTVKHPSVPLPLPKVLLDGPFGAGQQDWLNFEVSVMVGGGIGVTPYASILKDFVFRATALESFKVKCKKIYFIWVTADQKQFEWLIDILRSVEEVDKRDVIEIHIFITKLFSHYDLRTIMLYMFEEHVRKTSSGQSLFTGLKSKNHFGRPDFNMILRAIAEKHSQVKKVGVFSCGPSGLTQGVESACLTACDMSSRTRFIHHYENF